MANGNEQDHKLRAQRELDQAERWVKEDGRERKAVVVALAIAVILHAGILLARMPGWDDPVRVEKPEEEEVAMKVQFLDPPPPPPPPPETKPEPPKPETKKIPRPDPTPEEPEPVVEPPPPPPEAPREIPPMPAPPAPVTAPSVPVPAPAPAEDMGPIRVSPGQGPGIIKKVEPIYPPPARAARMEGTVVLDAVIRKDGTVSDVTVVESANKIFERVAVDALRQWRFSPGDRDVIMSLTVHFKLN